MPTIKTAVIRRKPNWWERRWLRKGSVSVPPAETGGEGAANHRDWEEGSTTVEYAIGAVAAAGFAGLLVAILRSGGVSNLITSIIESALSL